jgi:hypothetical protein
MQKTKGSKKTKTDEADEDDDDLDFDDLLDGMSSSKSKGPSKSTNRTVSYYRDENYSLGHEGYIGKVVVTTRLPSWGIRRVKIVRSESYPTPMEAMRKAKELANMLY